jgi:hypothetical protein
VQPAVVCRVAKAEEAVAATASSNGARTATDSPSNMLAFEELSDIIRCASDGTAGLQHCQQLAADEQ